MLNRMSVVCMIVALMFFGLSGIGSAMVVDRDAAESPHANNPPRDTGTVVYQFNAPSTNVDGMTWDGTNLWLGSDGLDRIYKMDTLGNVLDSFPAPSITATGLCWDGMYLWCADGGTIRIYKMDPATGAILDSIPAPGSNASCEGLAWMNDTLWNTNWSDDTIWELDPITGTVWGQFPAPGGAGSGSTGLTWDWHDNVIWNSDQLTDLIYKLDPVTGATITSFNCPDLEVQDLAFDGTYLWTCGWTSGIVYKMDIGYATGIEELPGNEIPLSLSFAPMANPVSGRSTISFNTSIESTVLLKVYNSAGNMVSTLVDGVIPAGTNTVLWDARDDHGRTLSTGIYFFKLSAGEQNATYKLTLIK